MMDILITALAFISGALATALLILPKALTLLKALEELTPEGTKIDTTLDTAIRWIEFAAKFLPGLASQAKAVSEALNKKKAE